MGSRLAPAAVLVFGSALVSAAPDDAGVAVRVGVTDEGTLTPEWSAMLRERLATDAYATVADSRRPLSAAERAWLDLVRERAAGWPRERAALDRPFAPAVAPPRVSVVVGNRAAPGDDAFTHDAQTIGFDLGELQSAYGDAGRPENADRIDRFFRHEYTHVLQRAWLDAHPWPLATPIDSALVETWKEGLGNLHSLSARWRAAGGGHSTAAREALAELEPRFVARLAALACATPESAARLTSDLSRGRFDRKWGALPVALWLATEPGDPVEAQRAFVAAGPAGVWDLADRRLPPALAHALREARDAAERCARPQPSR